ncbi:PH domain-containing protein [Nocardia sp. NPDC057227]|uniref:PH domain-containing protein n=1 Tax=Nocardia sp. NPDC057227 TaxID=3346056 RepID=UPI003636FA48
MSSPHQSVPPPASSHIAEAGSATGGRLRRIAAVAVPLLYLVFLAVAFALDWPQWLRWGVIPLVGVLSWLLWPRSPHGVEPGVRVIRVPQLAYIGVLILTFSVFFPFVGWPSLLWPLLLIPVVMLLWVERTRTTVTPEGLELRTVFTTKSVEWSRVAGVRLPKRGFVRARLTDESEVKLPAVGYDRLRELIAASDGRIPDVFAQAEEAIREQSAAERAAAAANDAAEPSAKGE